MDEKLEIIKQAGELLLQNSKDAALNLINNNYRFTYQSVEKRNYSGQRMKIFARDGFIDRYSGKPLVNPGMLKILSVYYPEDFPYQAHWKMTETHIAYWEYVPTIDHIEPIAAGGADDEHNWVSTSMLNNAIKSNWTLKQLGWELYEPGALNEWDGLSHLFVQLVNHDEKLLEDTYIKTWYKQTLSTIPALK